LQWLTEEELREMSAYSLRSVREAWNTVCNKLIAGELVDAHSYLVYGKRSASGGTL
jgi:hypothetical protein